MNPLKLPRSFDGSRRLAALSAVACMVTSSAWAVEKSYQYYRFEPLRMWNGGTQTQLSEFTFSLAGAVLNTNDRNDSGVGVIPVTITSGTQDPNAGEGPSKVGDGDNGSKWFKPNPFGEAEALTFTFTAPVTIDSYNWRSAGDSVGFNRSPVSWKFSGSTDGVTWELLDGRSNYPINNANDTDQAGFPLPDEVVPAITALRVRNTPDEGTPGIVLNGSPLNIEWESLFSDATTLAPDGGAAGSNDMVEVTPPSNATTTYTLTATQTGVTGTATDDITVRAVTGGSAIYQYVRFKATKLRSGQATGAIQLREFGFLNDDLPVTVSFVENPGGNSPAAEGVANLIDGSANNNKWLDGNNAPVIFDFGTPTTIDSYYFFTGNDAIERDPIQWTLEGSDDLVTWNLIENVNFDYPTTLDRDRDSRAVPLPGPSLSPIIRSFVGNAATAIQGEPFTLSWDVYGATTRTIDQGVGAVATSGSLPLTPPLGETTYTLTTTAGNVNETSSFTVTVIEPPAINTINYADFSEAADEMTTLGSTQFVDGVLRLTPDDQGQRGEAWFRYKQPVGGGFEATFKMSMNQDAPNGTVPADGLAFVIQNNAAGSDASSIGEGGVPENALNIKFKSFGFNGTDASQIQVLAGTQILGTASAYDTPGVVLTGIPDDPATEANEAVPYGFGTKAGAAPYQIRVVYVPGTPGHIDVYFDGIAILQNVEVDLADIGAVDGAGKAFVGFAARTGANVQNNDIIDWKMGYGDFSALPPFGLVKAVTHRVINGAETDLVVDLVWNAEADGLYNVTRNTGLEGVWGVESEHFGQAGQLGRRIVIDPATVPREFFRVEEVEAP